MADPSKQITGTAKTDATGRFEFPRLYPFGIPADPSRRAKLEVSADGYETWQWDAKPVDSPDGGLRIVVAREGSDALALLQGVERVCSSLAAVQMEIEAYYNDSRGYHVSHHEVIVEKNKYRVREAGRSSRGARSIFDGEQILNYDGNVSCTIRSPSKPTLAAYCTSCNKLWGSWAKN